MEEHRFNYQRQDSVLTLTQGLEEYYQANVGTVMRPEALPPESAQLFVSHDTCHVIFGLTTALADEAMTDIRTILSTDVGLARYLAYLKRDSVAQALFQNIGFSKSVFAAVEAAPRMIRAVGQVWRMKKRWPWIAPQSLLDELLADLRGEYGIHVI